MPIFEKKEKNSTKVIRELAPYLNLGLQLAITVCLFCLLGWWLDKHYGTAPMWLLILSILGVIVAMYNFLRTVLKSTTKKKR